MKNIIKSFVLLVFTAFTVIGCNELDDIGPVGRLSEDEAIINAESAETVLNGVYTQLRESGFHFYGISMFNKMGLTAGVLWGSPDSFHLNQPHPGLNAVSSYFNNLYRLIQEANLFIENIQVVDAEVLGGDAAKNNFIGEARFLRGLAYFYLLRSYGEHFDTASEYGVTLRLTPARDASVLPRNTVAETYTAIEEDLQFAIDNCFASNLSYKGNPYAAKAMLAKTLLYKGEYPQAAILAGEVITDSGGRVFADPYVNNFAEVNVRATIDSPELLFAPFTNQDTERMTSIPSWDDFSSGLYPNFGFGDPRYGVDKGSVFVFVPSFTASAASHIHMRLSEVYLIHAEAEARAGSGVDAEALASLNAIRTRTAVGLPLAAPADKAELLEAIQLEKLLELYGENGEEFFDMVRFAKLDGFDPSSWKPSMTNPDFYILPIPNSERQAIGGDAVIQNPGY